MATVNVSSASTSIAEEGLEQCKHCHGILRVHLSSVKECTKSPSCDSCVPCVDCLHKTPNSQHPPQLSSSSSMAMLSSSLLQSNSEMYGSMTDIQSSLSNIAQADDRRTGRKKKGTSIIHGTSSSSLMGSMNGSSGGGGILGSNNQLTSTLTRKISINEKDGSNNNATSPKKMSSVTASLVAANRLRRIAANNTNDSTNLVAAMNKEILHTAVNKELLSKTRASSVPVSSVPATSIGGDNTTLGRSATTHNTQIAAAAASSSSIKTPLITNTTADIAIQPTMVVTSPIIMVEEEENVGNDDHDEEDNDDKFPEMKFNPNDKTTNSRENLLTLRRVSTIKLKIGAGELEPPQRNSTNTATTHHHSMELLSEKLPVQRNKPSFEGEEELLGLHEPVIKGAAGRVKSPSVGNSLHLSDPNLLANVPGAQSNILPKPVALGYEMENKGSSGEKMFRSGDIGNSNGSNLNIDERGPIVIMTKAEVTSASITTNNERLSTATAAAASSSLQTPGGQSELKSANKNRFTRSFDNFMKSMKSSPSTSNLSQMDTPTTTTTPTNSSKQATADTAIKPTTTNPLSHGGDIAGGVETSTPSSNPVPINNNRLSFLNSPSSLSGSFSGSSSSGSPVKKGVGKMSRLGNASAPIMGFKSFKTTKEWYANFAAEVQQQIKYAIPDEFPSEIGLQTMFGSKGDGNDLSERILWAARCYETAKSNTLWNIRDTNLIVSPNAGDEIKYRVLNIFSDERIPALEYNGTRPDGASYVSAGKPLDLLDGLIFPTNQDSVFSEIFLATFRFFMSAEKVLESLVEWYDVDLYEDCSAAEEHFLRRHRKAIQTRVMKVIIMWIKNYWQDFANSKLLEATLNEFVARISEISFGDNQRLTQAIREQKLSWYTTRYIPAFPTKKTNYSANDPVKCMAMLWETNEFAKLLTLVDNFFYRQVKPDTYLHLMQIPATKQSGAQNVALKAILDYVTWFRLNADYVSSIILSEDANYPKKRAILLKRFVKLAKECRVLQNYNTMFSIIAGLKRKGIANLNQVWEQLPSKHLESFREMEEMTEPNSPSYWAEVKTASPPLIPFFAAYVQDLVEIHEEAPTYISGIEDQLSAKSLKYIPNEDPLFTRKVNFQKYCDLYSITAMMERFRNANYSLPPLNPPSTGNNSHLYIQSDHEYYGILMNHMREWILANPLPQEAKQLSFDTRASVVPATAPPAPTNWGGM